MADAHQADVRKWRELEKVWQHKAVTSPHLYHLVLADDTSARQFPHTTERPYKSNANRSTPEFIPWLYHDYSHRVLRYIYSLKGQHTKGANRWCTMIFNIMKGLKTSRGNTADARTFVFIGDNYSENKNNTNLAFLSDIVKRGWYDEIILLYGPVGHTHNGIDAVHKVHNQNLARFNAGNLGDWINLYPQAWTKEDTRPSAGVCTALLDWDAYYKGRVNSITGYTKTKTNKGTVQGWRIARREGQVEVTWQPAALLAAPWLGVDGKEATSLNPGYIVLYKNQCP